MVGRDEADNERLEALAAPDDCLLVARDFPGPTTLARGEFDDDALRLAASITVRYGRGRDEQGVAVDVTGARACSLIVPPAQNDELEKWRL